MLTPALGTIQRTSSFHVRGWQGRQCPQGGQKEKENVTNRLRTLMMFNDPGRRVPVGTGEMVEGQGRGKVEFGKGENREWESEDGAGYLTGVTRWAVSTDHRHMGTMNSEIAKRTNPRSHLVH